MAPRQISTRRRAQPEIIPDSIFDSISPESGGNTPAKKDATKKEPTIAEVMEKLGALSQRMEDNERTSAATSTYTPAQPSTPSFTEAIPTMNLEGLPDPMTDPKAYAAEIATRTLNYQGSLKDWETRRQQALTPKPMGNPDAVFEEFAEQFPEYTEDEERISFATAQVSKKLAKRGIDVQKYLYTQTPQLFKQITAEYDRVFGKPEAGDQDADLGDELQEQTSAPRRRARPVEEDDGDDGRTQGILGGQEPGAPGSRPNPPPGDMMKDLTDMQRKSGYF